MAQRHTHTPLGPRCLHSVSYLLSSYMTASPAYVFVVLGICNRGVRIWLISEIGRLNKRHAKNVHTDRDVVATLPRIHLDLHTCLWALRNWEDFRNSQNELSFETPLVFETLFLPLPATLTVGTCREVPSSPSQTHDVLTSLKYATAENTHCSMSSQVLSQELHTSWNRRSASTDIMRVSPTCRCRCHQQRSRTAVVYAG